MNERHKYSLVIETKKTLSDRGYQNTQEDVENKYKCDTDKYSDVIFKARLTWQVIMLLAVSSMGPEKGQLCSRS